MKTVILCGGKGTRLAEETEYRPKPLAEIGGKPILWHILKIYEHQGNKDFVLCLGYKGNMIKEYFLNLEQMSHDFVLDLRNSQKINLNEEHSLEGKISFVNTGLNTMTGSRIARIKNHVSGDEDFFVTYSDAVSDIDLKELYNYHKRMGKVATITAVRPVYRFGLVEIKDGLVTKFDEKPDMKDLINGGFMVFNRRIFNYLSEDQNCTLEQEPMKKLSADGQLAAYCHGGFWKCMDTQKELDELNRIYSQGAPWVVWK